MNESFVSRSARSPSRWTSRPPPSQRSSRQQSVTQPPRRTAKSKRTDSIVSVNPMILLAATPAYKPQSQPKPALQQKAQSHLSLNSHVQPRTKIFSKRIHSGGSISFLLRTVDPALDTSRPDIIEVPAEAIYDYVTWEDLQAFEHDDFEKELAEKEYERREKYERRERAQLIGNDDDVKRGRGRPKKIRDGDLVPAVDQEIMGSIVANSEEESSESESGHEPESTSSENDESRVRASIQIPSKSSDDRPQPQFKIEIPSPGPKNYPTAPIPLFSIFDRGRVKVRSEVTQGLRDPKSKLQAEPDVKASVKPSTVIIDLANSANEPGILRPSVDARETASRIPIRLPAERVRSRTTDSDDRIEDGGALLRQFQDQMNVTHNLQTPESSNDVNMADSQKKNESTPQHPKTADEMDTESDFNSDSDSERVDLLRQFQQPLPQKPVAQKTPTPKPASSNPPPATSASSKLGDPKPSTSLQPKKKPPNPVFHHSSSDDDDDDDDDDNPSKAELLLQKFQPKTFLKKPLPTHPPPHSPPHSLPHPPTNPPPPSLPHQPPHRRLPQPPPYNPPLPRFPPKPHTHHRPPLSPPKRPSMTAPFPSPLGPTRSKRPRASRPRPPSSEDSGAEFVPTARARGTGRAAQKRRRVDRA